MSKNVDLSYPEEKDIVHQGEISKRGDDMLKNWKKRWFTLDSNGILLYFVEKKRPQTAKGSIRVSAINSIKAATPQEEAQLGKNVFMLKTADRTYFLKTDSDAERDKWIYIIKKPPPSKKADTPKAETVPTTPTTPTNNDSTDNSTNNNNNNEEEEKKKKEEEEKAAAAAQKQQQEEEEQKRKAEEDEKARKEAEEAERLQKEAEEAQKQLEEKARKEEEERQKKEADDAEAKKKADDEEKARKLAEEAQKKAEEEEKARKAAQAAASSSNETEWALAKLRSGNLFLKHGRKGEPHERWVWLEADSDLLVWDKDNQGKAAKAKKEEFHLKNIKEIVLGKKTEILLRADKSEEDTCFSLIVDAVTSADKASLDLELQDSLDRPDWVKAFQLAVAHFREKM